MICQSLPTTQHDLWGAVAMMRSADIEGRMNLHFASFCARNTLRGQVQDVLPSAEAEHTNILCNVFSQLRKSSPYTGAYTMATASCRCSLSWQSVLSSVAHCMRDSYCVRQKFNMLQQSQRPYAAIPTSIPSFLQSVLLPVAASDTCRMT